MSCIGFAEFMNITEARGKKQAGRGLTQAFNLFEWVETLQVHIRLIFIMVQA